MTIGRTQEAPAAYALTSTIKRLLDHLTEADLYSAKDLNSMGHTLSQLDKVMTATDHSHSPYIIELLANRLELCHSSLDNLKKRVDGLQDPLQSIHERLISILRSMSLANTKAKVRTHKGGRIREEWMRGKANRLHSFRHRRSRDYKRRSRRLTSQGWMATLSDQTVRFFAEARGCRTWSMSALSGRRLFSKGTYNQALYHCQPASH